MALADPLTSLSLVANPDPVGFLLALAPWLRHRLRVPFYCPWSSPTPSPALHTKGSHRGNVHSNETLAPTLPAHPSAGVMGAGCWGPAGRRHAWWVELVDWSCWWANEGTARPSPLATTSSSRGHLCVTLGDNTAALGRDWASVPRNPRGWEFPRSLTPTPSTVRSTRLRPAQSYLIVLVGTGLSWWLTFSSSRWRCLVHSSTDEFQFTSRPSWGLQRGQGGLSHPGDTVGPGNWSTRFTPQRLQLAPLACHGTWASLWAPGLSLAACEVGPRASLGVSRQPWLR